MVIIIFGANFVKYKMLLLLFTLGQRTVSCSTLLNQTNFTVMNINLLIELPVYVYFTQKGFFLFLTYFILIFFVLLQGE